MKACNPTNDINSCFIQSALQNRIVGHRIYHYDQLSSTMDEARKFGDSTETEGLVILAEEQTAARGRFDRRWISPKYENLAFSVLLKPTIGQLPYMNMAASLAIAKTVREFSVPEITKKWPNDVRAKGRKIAGVLIEAAMESEMLHYAVLGIGINVNLNVSEHSEIEKIATSLFYETGKKHSRQVVFRCLLENIDFFYSKVISGKSLTAEWRMNLETIGKEMQLSWRNRILHGLAEDVDDFGNLKLRTKSGETITVAAGEVTSQI